MSFDLTALGWSPGRNEEFAQHAAEGLVPARAVAQHRGGYVVCAEHGERPAEVAGRLRHTVTTAADLPAVGDWLAIEDGQAAAAATIHAVLERATAFSRTTAGRDVAEQVVAANVDVVFLVGAFGDELNVRRLERYVAAGWESGAEPVIVLNKRDLAGDLAAEVAGVEAVAFGVPVHAVSCLDGAGVDGLRPYLEGDRTAALLGSSGVGKSSLLNRLLGWERQETAGVRDDGKGRHTTTRRELVPLPGGGLVLDTPGMRELGLWAAGAGVEETFADVSGLAARCRFADCAHETEPGCAVLAALAAGTLAEERLESYRKLQRELLHQELKADPRARSEARKARRRFARSLRNTAY
ncbi:MAG TPA: ribosome small subunit-dependent GTPase A [Gaiellaceae bacterium]|nr:ribosome small subunit-dependent GTPase A [Gaiellaceae bacterium]